MILYCNIRSTKSNCFGVSQYSLVYYGFMALIGRTWTSSDKVVSDMLNKFRDETKISFRRLEQLTGIKYSRLRNISNCEQGTPTLSEFIAIADVTGYDISEKMEQISQIYQSESGDGVMLVADKDPNKNVESETPDD